MRAIVVTHDPVNPVRGGGALRTIRVSEELRRRGFDVVLLAPGADGVRLPPPRKRFFSPLSVLCFNFRVLVRLLGLLSGKRAEIVVVHNAVGALFLPLLRLFCGVRFVLDVTDFHAGYLVLGRLPALRRVAAALIGRVEFMLFRSADRITAATSAMAAALCARGVGAGRVSVVYDGVDVASFADRIKTSGAQAGIIHLGAVDRQQGVDLLVRAAPAVLRRRPETKFWIVGGGRGLDRIFREAQRLGVSGAFEFTGPLEGARAREFLDRAGIGVIARPDIPANRLVTTLKLFEYWASGTAVVAPRLAGIAEVAREGEGALLFPPGDPDALAACLVRLLEDGALRGALAAEGRRLVRNFDFSVCAAAVADTVGRALHEAGVQNG